VNSPNTVLWVDVMVMKDISDAVSLSIEEFRASVLSSSERNAVCEKLCVRVYTYV
jgi:hypothetical protein